MREVTFDRAKAKELVKALTHGRMVEPEGGAGTPYTQDELLSIAGACMAVLWLGESAMVEMRRSNEGRQIHQEHREVEYYQHGADIQAAIDFLAGLTMLSFDRDSGFDLYCEPRLRAKVEAAERVQYAVLPLEGFHDDNPWYPLTRGQEDQSEEQDEQP